MIRQTTSLARVALRVRAPAPAPAVVSTNMAASTSRRLASTHAPTGTSGTPEEAGISTRLAPGEEIDPQLAGYPQLPYVSLQTREPFGWWDQQERKNFGETMHEEQDVLGMWGPDVHKISGPTAVFALIAAFTGIAGFTYAITAARPQPNFVRREYPYGGLEKELGGHVAARPESEDDAE